MQGISDDLGTGRTVLNVFASCTATNHRLLERRTEVLERYCCRQPRGSGVHRMACKPASQLLYQLYIFFVGDMLMMMAEMS